MSNLVRCTIVTLLGLSLSACASAPLSSTLPGAKLYGACAQGVADTQLEIKTLQATVLEEEIEGTKRFTYLYVKEDGLMLDLWDRVFVNRGFRCETKFRTLKVPRKPGEQLYYTRPPG